MVIVALEVKPKRRNDIRRSGEKNVFVKNTKI